MKTKHKSNEEAIIFVVIIWFYLELERLVVRINSFYAKFEPRDTINFTSSKMMLHDCSHILQLSQLPA